MWHHVIDYFVLKTCLCYIVHSAESYQLCSFCSVHHKTTKWFQHFEGQCLLRFPLKQCLLSYNTKLKEYFQGSISLITGNTIVLKGLLFVCVCYAYTPRWMALLCDLQFNGAFENSQKRNQNDNNHRRCCEAHPGVKMFLCPKIDQLYSGAQWINSLLTSSQSTWTAH